MSSILRTSKFVRYFATVARSLTLNVRDANTSIIQHNHCLCSSVTQGFATAASPVKPNDANLEKSLQKIDQDVRRSGRISKRDIEEILDEIRHTRSANSSQSLLIIRCCGNLVPEELPEVRTNLVKEIWRTLNRLNVQIDVSHYNALLRVYIENEHEFSPTEFLADMEAKGIEPNRVTYQRLISKYCQQADIEGATRILEFMREKQLPVSENVFNALIMGHSKAGDMDSAKDILTVMGQAGLEPSADTYTALMCGYAQKGDMESMNSVIMDCESKDVYLLDKDYMDVIYVLSVNGHKDKIDLMMDKLKKSYGYNHDAINLILRLVNNGHEDIGMKIMKTMIRNEKSEGENSNSMAGSFFIRQLIRTNKPFDYIMEVCKEMESEGINPEAFSLFMENGFQSGNMEIVLGLLTEMKNRNIPIRHHYLWPLICREGKLKNDSGILEVLKIYMQFDLVPSGETMREFVYTNLQEKNPRSALNLARSAGLSEALCASSLVMHLLANSNLKVAADIASSYRAYHSPHMIRKSLNQSLAKTGDVQSYVKIIHQVQGNMNRRETLFAAKTEEIAEETENEDKDISEASSKIDSTGLILTDLTFLSSKVWMPLLDSILSALVEKGLGISNHNAELLQDRIGDQLTPELSALLSKLTSGELEPVPLQAQTRSRISANDQIYLENLISNLEKKGEQPKGLKRQLLTVYCRNKELNKLEALIEELKKESFAFSCGCNAQILEAYVHFENVEKAMEYYNIISSADPNFAIDDSKIVRLVSILIKNNKFAEAIKILDAQPSERKLEDRTFSYNSVCWRLLNSLAESKNVEQLKLVFDKLVANHFIEINNMMLGPLIKVHLLRDDLDEAMRQFEMCCKEHQSTPWKTELACRLIQKEDATNLQKLTDLSTTIHGEVNSLYDLVFAFVECGRVRQARKILETPGLRSRAHRMNTACERYLQEGMVRPLEGLVEATKDLTHIDRTEIYYNLLSSYCNSDETDKALGLWTQMQEEDLPPTNEFLAKLGTYLQCKNLPVPFAIPECTTKNSAQPREASKQQLEASITSFHKMLRMGEVDKAVSLKKQLAKEGRELSINENSLLLEALLKHDRFKESSKLIFEMLEKGVHPLPRIFRFSLNKLANKGDIETLQKIGSSLNSEMKKLTSFDNRLCHAYIAAGKSEQYLDVLEKLINSASDDELRYLTDSFPRGAANGLIENHPELLDKFEKLAEKYSERGIKSPMNVLWAHYFVKGEEQTADKLWSNHLSETPRLMIQKITDAARMSEDHKLVDRLEKLVKQTKFDEIVLGKVYSCKLDLLTAKEKYDEALEYLKNSLKDVCLEHFSRAALIRIRDGLKTQDKMFPYEIPTRKSKSSSSSSSDDENDNKNEK